MSDISDSPLSTHGRVLPVDNLQRLAEQMAAGALVDLRTILDAARAEQRAATEVAARATRLLERIEQLAAGLNFGLEAVRKAREELEQEQRPEAEQQP